MPGYEIGNDGNVRRINLEQKKLERIDVSGLEITFQRTCRVPEGQLNSLPAGLGPFPVYKVADFKSGTPKEWHESAYFIPMYPQEAMWMNFARYVQNPKALIVGAGNINAVSGKPFAKSKQKRKGTGLDIKLEKDQNYLVVPPQPWLDGWKAADGKVYQFVAAELGSGETVEGQITGEESVGGLQFIVFDPKDGQKLIHATRPHEYVIGGSFDGFLECAPAGGAYRCCASKSITSMGLGRGGEIEQKIYPDPHGLNVWKKTPSATELVYMVSSEDFKQITGHNPPPTPVTYEKYQELGLPWFELHDKKLKDTKGSDVFGKLKPVSGGIVVNQEPDLIDKFKPKEITKEDIFKKPFIWYGFGSEEKYKNYLKSKPKDDLPQGTDENGAPWMPSPDEYEKYLKFKPKDELP